MHTFFKNFEQICPKIWMQSKFLVFLQSETKRLHLFFLGLSEKVYYKMWETEKVSQISK